jgi:chromosome segregation ATPase
VFVSKLQSQLSDALSESNGLRGNCKSLEAKVLELMSEIQMYRGQIDELQVLLSLLLFSCLDSLVLLPRHFAQQALLLCSKEQQRSLDSEAQANADRAIAQLQAQLASVSRSLSEEQVKVFQESSARQRLDVQLKDANEHCLELGLRIKDLDSSNRQLQERVSSSSQQAQ